MKLCPNCNTECENDSLFCIECGTKLSDKATKEFSDKTVNIATLSASDKNELGIEEITKQKPTRLLELPIKESDTSSLQCAYCDNNNPIDYNYCSVCGNLLVKLCPNCNKQIEKEAKFCGYCAYSLIESNEYLRLYILDDKAKQIIMRGQELTLGRENCDIDFLGNDTFSPIHARLILRDGKYYIEDLESHNGIFIRICQKVELQSGDEIIIGNKHFRIELPPK